MAATDQNYRNQRTLDVVFGASCVLMLAGVVWMFAQDYNREFKGEQRTFRQVEEALAERQMLALAPDQHRLEQIRDAEAKLAEAEKERQDKGAQYQSAIRKALVAKTISENKAAQIKAEYDSKISLYDIAVKERDAEVLGTPRHKTVSARADDLLRIVQELKRDYDKAQKEIEARTQELEQAKRAQKELDDRVSAAADRLKALTADFDRFAKLFIQKRWKAGDWFRSLWVIDAFNSPTRIQQVTLDELPIDFNFKYVTRYDRCATCHLGIDRPSFDKANLRALGQEPSKALLKWLDNEKQDELPEDLQDEPLANEVARLKTARMMLQERHEILKDKADFGPGDLRWVSIKLSPAQINEYCAHPRLDLFVGDKSPHPAEKFGCTICHGGQGSGTGFQLAAHTPNDSLQKNRWIAKHHWEENRDWEFPMLPGRFVESSCIQCHYQVLDLLPQGNAIEYRAGKQVPAPGTKVVRGYSLVRDYGCFGCHEIAGIKNGRWVGPDLRLEPSPPLEEMTPEERAKFTADPLHPPGSMRKVGPSLRRVSEKTNEDWVSKWLFGPRGFRPDTRMPHFYNLSNNRPDVLPDDQKDFPWAEIHGIAYYLFRESEEYLRGTDLSYRIDATRQEELKDKQQHGLLSDPEKKLLEEVTARMELRSKQKPVPIKEKLVAGDGTEVHLPPAPKDDKARQEQVQRGRQLFTTRGCLACHAHAGTTKAEAGLPPVASEANFGPNLSRLALKLGPLNGGEDAKRRWLVQWILKPTVHSPRTRMPVTHLTADEAGDVAAWLLSQKPDWEAPEVKDPEVKVYQDLARIYLQKSMTQVDVDQVFDNQGLSGERIKNLRRQNPEADELRLDAGRKDESWDNKLKWYVGRKAISQLGCFGCHEMPGFEDAKPIGTPLNDWGRKDPERLAFEDVVAYAKNDYHLVDQIVDEEGKGAGPEGDKRPYERYFFDALERHQRDGFLNQKLREPRSYDYQRLRAWDERLRMPQFKFGGEAKPLGDESALQAQARTEAEAREAVMTFILGLVAEPVPFKYLNDPPPDRLAEIKGKHVLEKFNCAGCHQLRSAAYEFNLRPPSTLLQDLEERYKGFARGQAFKADRNPDGSLPAELAQHNAWKGRPALNPERLAVHGLPAGPADEKSFQVRLTQALRLTKKEKRDPQDQEELPPGEYDIAAAEYVNLPRSDLVLQTDPHGGVLADLLAPYLVALARQGKAINNLDDDPKARSGLPPPLLREGEKTQPSWLFQFLRNPSRIRSASVMLLRMPRFNLSDDEAMALVNYFAAVDRNENPATVLNYPYLAVQQRDEEYLSARSQEYAQRLGKEKLQEQFKDLKPIWERILRERIAEVEEDLKAAEKAYQKALEADKETAKKRRDDLEQELKRLKRELSVVSWQLAVGSKATGNWQLPTGNLLIGKLREEFEKKDIYAVSAYRLLANKEVCLKCHQVGNLSEEAPTAPLLDEAPQRLRPEWTQRWMASPQRLLIYPIGQHPMPQPFPLHEIKYQDLFSGTSFQQATALRDILMTYPSVANMPANRYYRSGQGGNP